MDATASEEEALAAAEAQLPDYLATDSEDSDQDPDFMPVYRVCRAHDDEAGGSIVRPQGVAPPPSPPPPISSFEVPQFDTLNAILSRLTEQQRRSDERQDQFQALLAV